MKPHYFSKEDFNVIFKRALRKNNFVELQRNTVIKPETDLRKDLNMDSLDIMMAIMELEQKYNVKLSNAETTEIDTVKDVYNIFAAREKRIQNLYHHASIRPELSVENRKLKKQVMSLCGRQYNG